MATIVTISTICGHVDLDCSCESFHGSRRGIDDGVGFPVCFPEAGLLQLRHLVHRIMKIKSVYICEPLAVETERFICELATLTFVVVW